MVTSEKFCEDYFLRGPETGLSNYRDYRWMPERTVPACRKIKDHLGIARGESLLEVGCATGHYCRALRLLGVEARGYDISEWAVANADSEIRPYLTNAFPSNHFSWCLCKDTAEHIPEEELMFTMLLLGKMIVKGMLFIVPLSGDIGGPYMRKEDEQDATHIIRWNLDKWITFMEDAAPEFDVSGSYDIRGIKPASTEVPHSCGFLTLQRR